MLYICCELTVGKIVSHSLHGNLDRSERRYGELGATRSSTKTKPASRQRLPELSCSFQTLSKYSGRRLNVRRLESFILCCVLIVVVPVGFSRDSRAFNLRLYRIQTGNT